jgi:tetratricopeptide (TPR) repeat protein
MATPAMSSNCPKCGSPASVGDRFCGECGTEIQVSTCPKCSHPLQREANFCEACGTPVLRASRKPDAGALESLIAAIEMALRKSDPRLTLRSAEACLSMQPCAEQAAIASIIAMSAYAQLADFEKAQAYVKDSRRFYASHLGLPDHQQTEYVKTGYLSEGLLEVDDRDLEEYPWLQFILGSLHAPKLPDQYRGDTDAERRTVAISHWSDFVMDRYDHMLGALAFLHFTNGNYSEAARHLERVILIMRRYEAIDPIRIEFAWPRVVLGDCNRASGTHDKAAACWQDARSLQICTRLQTQLDPYSQFALPWVEKAKARLAESGIPVSDAETSYRSSQHLLRAIEYMVEAEQYEEQGVDLERLAQRVRRAGERYTLPVERAALELASVAKLDRFTWCKAEICNSTCWYRYEGAMGLLHLKKALILIAGRKLALAVASLKEAMRVWPTSTYCLLLGGLQATCGLVKDARATYQMFIDRTKEIGATESSADREEALKVAREVLSGLS